jgi:hypothetical protein
MERRTHGLPSLVIRYMAHLGCLIDLVKKAYVGLYPRTSMCLWIAPTSGGPMRHPEMGHIEICDVAEAL